MCQRRLQNKYLPSGPNCPPREPMQSGGGEAVRAPPLCPASISASQKMPKTTRNGQLQPTKIVHAFEPYHVPQNGAEITANGNHEPENRSRTATQQGRSHCLAWHSLQFKQLTVDSCFRLAKQSNHSRGTHFIPAGWAAGRPDFGDRILGPVSGPDLGPRALYLTEKRFRKSVALPDPK